VIRSAFNIPHHPKNNQPFRRERAHGFLVVTTSTFLVMVHFVEPRTFNFQPLFFFLEKPIALPFVLCYRDR
jgi:hypothetical protein